MSDKSLSDWIEPKYKTKKSSNVIPVSKKHSGTEEDITEITVEKITYENEDDHQFKEGENGQVIEIQESPPDNIILPIESESSVRRANNIDLSVSNNEYIQPNLERIIFDNNELVRLKASVNELMQGEIEPKALKKLILESYARIFREITEYISFYVAQNHKRLSREIEEKDELLEHLATRIDNIFLRLKEKGLEGTSLAVDLEKDGQYFTHLDNKSMDFSGEELAVSFVLDGSNISRDNRKSKEPSIQDVVKCREKLQELGVPKDNIIIIFGPALWHDIDDREMDLYEKLLEERYVNQAPAERNDDWYIIEYALEHNSYIITNDMYREYRKKSPYKERFLESHSIRYFIIGDDIYFEEGFNERLKIIMAEKKSRT